MIIFSWINAQNIFLAAQCILLGGRSDSCASGDKEGGGGGHAGY